MPADYQALLDRMSSDLGLMKAHLNAIMRTSPLRYKSFEIDKKDGSKRAVAQPAKEVKAVQRWLLSNVLDVLPVHECTTAYRVGRSIKGNAAAHVGSNYMLKVDFEQFFPSIKKSDIKGHLARHLQGSLMPDAIEMVSHCLTWAPVRRGGLELCIGAPSSPLISNSILYDFDEAISTYCGVRVAYTRYADDLTFSCNEKWVLDEVLEFVRVSLGRLEFPRIAINERKTVFASRKSRRVVTGIVLTPDHKLSVGRARKRLIRATYHWFLLGKLSDDEMEEMQGWIAFVESIEPGFKARLEESVKAGYKDS